MSAVISPPTVWVGCLCCYNNGRLVGEWINAIDGDTVTLKDIHSPSSPVTRDCEEMWCLDHELPMSGELSPHDAVAWGEAFKQVGPDNWRAYCAWTRSQGYDEPPSKSDFEDAFIGTWGDFDDFADSYAVDTDLHDHWPDLAKQYFDWSAWKRDLKTDFEVVEAPDGDVWIFSAN